MHEFAFRFHLAPGLETKVRPDGNVEVCDNMNGARLLIRGEPRDRKPGSAELRAPILEPRFSSRDYGAREPSVSVSWTAKTLAPLTMEFMLVPVCPGEDETERLGTVSAAGA